MRESAILVETSIIFVESDGTTIVENGQTVLFDLGEDKRAAVVCKIHMQPHADSQVEV